MAIAIGIRFLDFTSSKYHLFVKISFLAWFWYTSPIFFSFFFLLFELPRTSSIVVNLCILNPFGVIYVLFSLQIGSLFDIHFRGDDPLCSHFITSFFVISPSPDITYPRSNYIWSKFILVVGITLAHSR